LQEYAFVKGGFDAQEQLCLVGDCVGAFLQAERDQVVEEVVVVNDPLFHFGFVLVPEEIIGDFGLPYLKAALDF